MTVRFISAMGIYSGAGGYAAYRPGLVGLTPSQFREIRSAASALFCSVRSFSFQKV